MVDEYVWFKAAQQSTMSNLQAALSNADSDDAVAAVFAGAFSAWAALAWRRRSATMDVDAFRDGIVLGLDQVCKELLELPADSPTPWKNQPAITDDMLVEGALALKDAFPSQAMTQRWDLVARVVYEAMQRARYQTG